MCQNFKEQKREGERKKHRKEEKRKSIFQFLNALVGKVTNAIGGWGGPVRAPTRYGPKISQLHAVLLENLTKSYVGTP